MSKLNCIIIFLLLFTINLSEISAQETDSTAQRLILEYRECVTSGQENCLESFEIARNHIKNLDDEPNKGFLFGELATARIQNGLWDSISVATLETSIFHYGEEKNTCGQLNMLFNICGILMHKGEFEKAEQKSEYGIEISAGCTDSTLVSKAYSYKAGILLMQSRYTESLEVMHLEEKIAVEANDSTGLARVYQEKGTLYREIYQITEAFDYNKKAVALFKKMGDERSYGKACIDLSASYISLELPDSALVYLAVAKNIVGGSHLYFDTVIDHLMGSAQRLKGQNEVALKNQLAALKNVEIIGDPRLTMDTYRELSDLYSERDDKKEAYKYALKTKKSADELGNNTPMLGALYQLANAAYNVNQYEKSTKSFIKYIHLNDSLLNQSRLEEIAQLEEKYQAEKKELEIIKQKQANSLLKAENSAKRNQLFALIASLILVASLAYLLIQRQKNKTFKQRALVRVKELENDNLSIELNSKRRELTSQALHLAQKNELLTSIKNDLKGVKETDSSESIRVLSNKIKFDKQIDNNWEQFTMAFTETNTTFFKTLSTKHNEVSKSDLRLAALISMNLGSKEIASILNISDEGVKKARYRLRKKLSLERDDNLHGYLAGI